MLTTLKSSEYKYIWPEKKKKLRLVESEKEQFLNLNFLN